LSDFDLAALARIVEARANASPESSYTASLLARGRAHTARKFGEEAVEAVVAAVDGDPRELTAEAADVLFHLLVMLQAAGVTLDDVMAELERRQGTSGHEEKASRGSE